MIVQNNMYFKYVLSFMYLGVTFSNLSHYIFTLLTDTYLKIGYILGSSYLSNGLKYI